MSSLNFLPRGLCRQNNESCGQIGGPGMTVEIDESKFGKRSSTAVATSKDCGFSAASAAKGIKIHSYPSFEPTCCLVHA